MIYLIALGSNTTRDRAGPADIIAHAVWHFEGEGLGVVAQSRLYRAPAYPIGNGPDYVNSVVVVRADAEPPAVLDRLRRIEAALGQRPADRVSPREIAIDLLAAGNSVLPDRATVAGHINAADDDPTGAEAAILVLPHPRVHQRAGMLVPLVEVAPDWVHPVLGKSARDLLSALPANLTTEVVPYQRPDTQRDVAE